MLHGIFGWARRTVPRRELRAVGAAAAACLIAAGSGGASGGAREPMMQRVARDTTTAAGFQHATAVEPSIAGQGGVFVTVYQAGRKLGRGAAAIGYSTSRNGGRTWQQGLFTSVGRSGVTPSTPVDVTDAVVAYDPIHAVWIVASVADFANGSRTLQVHRSSDGLHWSAPTEVARGVIDHEWLACDSGTPSPFRGRCYVAFAREDSGRLGVRSSVDGGASWSGEAAVPSSLGHPTAAFPVVRPDGRLVLVFREGGSVLPDGRHPSFAFSSVRSGDGGRTFTAATRVAFVKPYFPPHFRGVPVLVPSVVADARGRLYAVWHSCRFRHPCRGNDLVLSRSSSGARWSKPQRVPLDRTGDHVIPGLGIAPGAPGLPVRLGLAYYTIASDRCRPAGCRIAPYFVSSQNGGRSWSRPLRLHAPMRFTWLAQSPAGQAFVSDTITTSFVGTVAWSAFAAATRPSGGTLHESVTVARVRHAELRWSAP